MFTTIRGIYSNGQVILQEPPPTTDQVEVLVTFTEKRTTTKMEQKQPKAGFSKGIVLYMAPDFDAPLDELKDYM